MGQNKALLSGTEGIEENRDAPATASYTVRTRRRGVPSCFGIGGHQTERRDWFRQVKR